VSRIAFFFFKRTFFFSPCVRAVAPVRSLLDLRIIFWPALAPPLGTLFPPPPFFLSITAASLLGGRKPLSYPPSALSSLPPALRVPEYILSPTIECAPPPRSLRFCPFAASPPVSLPALLGVSSLVSEVIFGSPLHIVHLPCRGSLPDVLPENSRFPGVGAPPFSFSEFPQNASFL